MQPHAGSSVLILLAQAVFLLEHGHAHTDQTNSPTRLINLAMQLPPAQVNKYNHEVLNAQESYY